jgi:adenine-specific DNA-methyltransferase
MSILRREQDENNMDSAGSAATTSEMDENGPSEPKPEAWRPIHYLGSKLRALPVIDQAILSVVPRGAPICDLFAGSGTVSAWLAQSHPVTAVDIQEYSRVICDALLNPAHIGVAQVMAELSGKLEEAVRCGVTFAATPLIEFESRALAQASRGELLSLAYLLEVGSLMTFGDAGEAGDLEKAVAESRARLATLALPPIASMALRHFGGVYFSYQQAAELDVILDYAHAADRALRSTLIAAALSTAGDLVNTVGKHFAQPLRPRNKDGTIKRSLYAQASRDRGKSVLEIFEAKLSRYVALNDFRYENRALRADYRHFLRSSDFDSRIVYADPPYTRDHYSRFYHVLETLALRDDPQISTNTAHGKTVLSRGVYRQDRHQSPFCIRSEAPAAFDELFGRVAKKGVPLVLSYSPYASQKNAHPRVMTIEAITRLARDHFRIVDVASVGTFFHSRLNRSDLNKDISYEAELLLTCRP